MTETIDNSIYVGKGKNKLKIAAMTIEEGKSFLIIKQKDKMAKVEIEELFAIILEKQKNLGCRTAS